MTAETIRPNANGGAVWAVYALPFTDEELHRYQDGIEVDDDMDANH
jgi:hypothetical protein